jgi:hypothetical protein
MEDFCERCFETVNPDHEDIHEIQIGNGLTTVCERCCDRLRLLAFDTGALRQGIGELPTVATLSSRAGKTRTRRIAIRDYDKHFQGGARPSVKRICQHLDKIAIPVPEYWAYTTDADDFTVTTWVEALEHPDFRDRVHKMISQDRRNGPD